MFKNNISLPTILAQIRISLLSKRMVRKSIVQSASLPLEMGHRNMKLVILIEFSHKIMKEGLQKKGFLMILMTLKD